jgi:hypothetical protein
MRKLLLLSGLAMGLASSSALADIIPTLFTTSGNVCDSGGGCSDVSGTVIISESNDTLTLTLQNTSNIVENRQVLTDFEFASIAGVTYTDLSVADPSGKVGCISSGSPSTTNCTSITDSVTSPFGWGVFDNNTVVELGAGISGSGATTSFALHPYGIVDTALLTNCNGTKQCDGLGSAQLNPYLLGPVTFTITLNQDITLDQLKGITFTWGTEGLATPVTSTGGPPVGFVPEPNSSALALLGLAMMGVTFYVRRRSRRS